MSLFKTIALKELTDQQVRFAPPACRMDQLNRIDQLLKELDSEKEYPYAFLCFRVTDFRPTDHADVLISGEDAKHDLMLFMNELARSLPAVPVEKMDEPVLTLEQMSKRLNVSTKTIQRWRQRGLIGLPIVCNGRRQVGFLPSLVQPFLDANQERVERGSKFSQLSENEKDEILRRAKRLSRLEAGTLTEVSRRIGRRLGRSPETIRYTIKNFDKQHPEEALYPALNGPMDEKTKQQIYNSVRRGIDMDTLAKKYHRTRNAMYRVVNEVRARRLQEQKVDFVPHPQFEDPKAEAEILAPMPGLAEFEERRQQMHAPKDTPAELAGLYEAPLLSREQEYHLFRKMNYLKSKAARMLEQVVPERAREEDLDRIEELLKQSAEAKGMLIKCNMRLVVSIAKKHSAQTDNFFELLSDGNVSLMRAVEKFDFSRGFKFSTYASWAIMKNFARSIPEEKHRRERYVTGHEEIFEASPDNRTNEHEVVAGHEQATHRVNRLLDYLEPRERQIIRMRAGLDNYSEGMTLEEIGQQLGITKERVRQLNVRIMNKLRSLAHEQKVEIP